MWRMISVLVLFVVTVVTCDLEFVLHKASLYALGLCHLLLSRDRKWSKKKVPDPDEMCGIAPEGRIRIVFIRHGESAWNEIFNKGKMRIPYRLARGIAREIALFFTDDSIFIDSPLNGDGLRQVHELARFLRAWRPGGAEEPAAVTSGIRCLRGEEEEGGRRSVVVSSNLRRAIATATIALWGRLQRTKERVKILTFCQEMSRNIDTLALAPAKAVPDLKGNCGDLRSWDPALAYDTALNSGNKKLFGTSGLKRMRAFCEWAFKQAKDPKQGASTVIVGGHSLFFRTFFQTFLPKSVGDKKKGLDCAVKKMVNAGAVSFELTTAQVESGAIIYRVVPESIHVLYGGYE